MRKDIYRSNVQVIFELYSHLRYLQVLYSKLEQLERLRSEDTPRRPMITHTIDQFISDPKSKRGESRKIRKFCEKFKFQNFVIDLTRDTPSNGSDYLWQIWK